VFAFSCGYEKCNQNVLSIAWDLENYYIILNYIILNYYIIILINILLYLWIFYNIFHLCSSFRRTSCTLTAQFLTGVLSCIFACHSYTIDVSLLPLLRRVRCIYVFIMGFEIERINRGHRLITFARLNEPFLLGLVSYHIVLLHRKSLRRICTVESGIHAGRSTILPAEKSRKSHMFTGFTR